MMSTIHFFSQKFNDFLSKCIFPHIPIKKILFTLTFFNFNMMTHQIFAINFLALCSSNKLLTANYM